jgi:hypothetical protein
MGEQLTLIDKIYNYLLFLTNNEKKPVPEWRQDEINFDIGFFIACVTLLIVGVISLGIYIKTKQDVYLGIMFACEFAMCFVWIWDNIRHNRED